MWADFVTLRESLNLGKMKGLDLPVLKFCDSVFCLWMKKSKKFGVPQRNLCLIKVIRQLIDAVLIIWFTSEESRLKLLLFLSLGVAHQCYHGFIKAVQEGNIQWESRTYPYPGTPITQRFSHSKYLLWKQIPSCLWSCFQKLLWRLVFCLTS